MAAGLTGLEDLDIAADLRRWTEDRQVARKRINTVAAAFGWTNLTGRARGQIEEAIRAVGLEACP